jgi:hypothetical protein
MEDFTKEVEDANVFLRKQARRNGWLSPEQLQRLDPEDLETFTDLRELAAKSTTT